MGQNHEAGCGGKPALKPDMRQKIFFGIFIVSLTLEVFLSVSQVHASEEFRDLESLARIKALIIHQLRENQVGESFLGFDLKGVISSEQVAAKSSGRQAVRVRYDLEVCIDGHPIIGFRGEVSKEAAAGFRARQYAEDALASQFSQELMNFPGFGLAQRAGEELDLQGWIDWYFKQVGELQRVGEQAIDDYEGEDNDSKR